MKFIKTFLLPLLLIVVCGLLLRSTYVEIKSRAIDQLNNQQLIMAETAARGIESFFEHYTELLTQLSKMSEIASFDERGRQLMQILYRTHANEIRGITRVGPSGQIIYTFPEIPGAIGTDLSAQEHVHKIIQTHQPVVSDVFDSIQGYMCIAFHVPVFRDEAFQGSLAVLIPFDQLSRKYLEPIKIGKDGYAWIISHKGIELYCPVPGHIGRSVFENCKDFPTILSMAQEMMRGHRGTTTYFFDRVRGETVESLKKQAVYVPVHLGNTFWSIVVATPEDEVLENIQGFRDRWFLIIGVLILTMIVWTSYLLRAFKILKEEEKRRRAEESLRMTNETLQAIVAASPVAIMTLDREGKVMKWSPAAERIFGWKEEEVIGRSNPIVPEDRIDEFRADFTRVIGGEKHPKAREMPSQKKDGSLIEISVSTAPLRDAKGEITGAVGIIDDITERKRAEEELNISSQRLSRAEIISRSGNWEFDLESQRVFASDGARKVYGLLDAEWTIPEVQKLPLPEYREMLDRALRELIQENRPYDVEFKIRRPDTGEIVDIRSVAEYDQNRKVVFGIIRDITLRKRAETALRESEARSMAFMEFIPALTLIKDHELKPIYANRKYREQFAFDDWFGKKPHETFPVEVAELIVRKDTEALQKGYTCYEETWLDKYQEPHVYQTQKFRIDIQDSEPLLGAIISDITDQKRMEQERQDLRERLYRAEKMEALGTLAGGVAHDLNNVLGVLVGYSELLLEKMPVDSPSRKYAANILKSGEWGAAIIQDLLTLARRGVAVSEVVNLNSIISDYFRTLEFERLQDDHPAVTFQTDLDKDLMNIKGSPVHLTKTLMNLLSNAAEAIEGGGEISIRTENRYLDRPVREYDKIPEGDYVVLKVTDNGKGISPADLGKIFEPFYTKKVMGRSGTGLGLAVVWGTVKDHGGFLDVQSDEGKGSTFTLYFPVTREELTREEQKISLDQYLGREESILVVDDVEGQRELAISMLTRLGYRVHAVSSGEEAVAYVKSHQVDLLVLDMIMEPGIDGLETYQRILEINPKQRAVIVSGFSETDRVKKAQSLGAGAYVKKPYVLEKLGLAVKRELVRAV